MRNYMNSAVGYLGGGAVNVLMYDYDKTFRHGDRANIRISSQVKLTKVSYCWGNEVKTDVNFFFNRPYFKVRIPEFSTTSPELKVITEVKFRDGSKKMHEHLF